MSDMADQLEARPLEFLQRKARTGVGRVELPGARHCIPLRLEPWEYPGDLVEADTVGARVRSGIGGEFEAAVRNHLGDDLGNLADPVIVPCLADVEGLVVDLFARRLQPGDECTGNVLDVNNRPPWTAVGLEQNDPLGDRPGDEIVEDNVESKSRGETIGSRRAEIGRRKIAVGQFRY